MTNKITFEITSCKQCPHHTSDKYYTSDSWDDCHEWKCAQSGTEERIYILDWNDKDPGIPSDCPLLPKETDI